MTNNRVEINGVFVDRSLLRVSTGRKYEENGQWVLTTRRGVLIATFPSEEALEVWWASFQADHRRVVGKLLLGEYQAPNRRSPRRRTKGGGRLPGSSASDYLKPWNSRYGMPEIDLE